MKFHLLIQKISEDWPEEWHYFCSLPLMIIFIFMIKMLGILNQVASFSGLEKKLRVIFDDLLGPSLSSTAGQAEECSQLPKIMVSLKILKLCHIWS